MKSGYALSTFFMMVVVTLFSMSTAMAGTAEFDKQMVPIYVEYTKIHHALTADSTDGIRDSAKRIEALAAKLNASSVAGDHADHYKGLPGNIEKAASTLAAAGDIAAFREAFKGLSKPMSMWVTMSKPEKVNLVYCSMAKGSWLQDGAVISNPYLGTAMPGCGDIVAGPNKKSSDEGEHSGSGGHNEHPGHGN